jgi:hypothetical protein
LHSNIVSSFSFSSPLLLLEEPGSFAAAILVVTFEMLLTERIHNWMR